MLWKLTQDTNREIPANAAVNSKLSILLQHPFVEAPPPA